MHHWYCWYKNNWYISLSRSRLTKRRDSIIGSGSVIQNSFEIDSDTTINQTNPDYNHSSLDYVLLGSGTSNTGGSRPIFKANLLNSEKWSIGTSDYIMSATLKLYVTGIEGSGGYNDNDSGEGSIVDNELVNLTTGTDVSWTEGPGSWNDGNNNSTGLIIPGGDDDGNDNYAGNPMFGGNPYDYYIIQDWDCRVFPHKPGHIPELDSSTWKIYNTWDHWTIEGAGSSTDDFNEGISHSFVLLGDFGDQDGDQAYELDVTEHARYALQEGEDFSVQLYRAYDNTGVHNTNLTTIVSVSSPAENYRPRLTIKYKRR